MDSITDKRPPLRPKLYVALEGAGVRPDNVPLDQLAQLLEAARALFEQISHERDRPTPRLALTAIEPGSARYALSAVDPGDDDQFAVIVPSFHKAIKKRGEGYGEAVKQALRRLHKVGHQSGGISVRAEHVGLGGARKLKRIVMAPPLIEHVSPIAATTVLYGQVLAVESKRAGMSIRIKPSLGAAIDLAADDRLARRAAKYFTDDVEVKAMAHATEQWPWSQWKAISIAPWQPSSLLAVMDDIARDMKPFDAAAAVRALDEDE